MKKFIFSLMAFSLIFAATSVTLAEDSTSTSATDAPVPTLYTTSDSSNELKPIPAEWMRGTSTNASSTKMEERKREEMKKKLEADKKALESKLENAKKQLEKISHPGEISMFEKIQKIGTALWGVKKAEVKASSTDVKEANASSTKANLEKISSPSEISLFERIQKIGTALWGVKKKVENKLEKIENKASFVKPVALQCTKDAINKKDTALQTTISTRAQAIVSAIETRNACQNTALDKSTAKEQFEANKLCVEAYKKTGEESNKTLEKSKNEIWKVYKDDLKICSDLQKNSTSTEVSTSTETASGEIMINDGEEANLIR